MERRKIIVVMALGFEARGVRRALGGAAEVMTVGLRAAYLPSLAGAGCVLVAGLAGALDPSLAVGDLVLDSPVEVKDGPAPLRQGVIHTSDRIVASAAAKRELFRRTGALAVDMELAVVRNAMEGSGVPVIGLRAISDPADVAVDPAVLGFVDPRGRTRPLVVAAALLQRPSLLGELRKLGAASKMALRRLGEGVRWLVEEGL